MLFIGPSLGGFFASPLNGEDVVYVFLELFSH